MGFKRQMSRNTCKWHGPFLKPMLFTLDVNSPSASPFASPSASPSASPFPSPEPPYHSKSGLIGNKYSQTVRIKYMIKSDSKFCSHDAIALFISAPLLHQQNDPPHHGTFPLQHPRSAFQLKVWAARPVEDKVQPKSPTSPHQSLPTQLVQLSSAAQWTRSPTCSVSLKRLHSVS